MDMNTYTVVFPQTVVKVSEFRGAIAHLERLVHVDYHACVGAAEKADWLWRAKRAGAELIGMTCRRATKDDWDRRERAIDRSAKRIGDMAP